MTAEIKAFLPKATRDAIEDLGGDPKVANTLLGVYETLKSMPEEERQAYYDAAVKQFGEGNISIIMAGIRPPPESDDDI